MPIVGSNSKELGVRVPPNPNQDVDLDEKGNVVVNGKGMSVAENWRMLPPHLIPKRLKAKFAGASGSDNVACFRFGKGPFAGAALNGRLQLVLKEHNAHAGHIVPIISTPERDFQADLAATRGNWTIDEA